MFEGVAVGPKTTPGSMISWKAYRTQHLITFMTDLSHWKDIKHNQLRGKAHKVKSRENQGQFSKSPLPVESRMSVTTHVKCCQLQKLVRDLVPRVFIGGWSYRHLLLGIYPSSRLPKGKQVFSINLMFVQSSCTVSHTYQFWTWHKCSWNLIPRHWPRAKLVSMTFYDKQSGILC